MEIIPRMIFSIDNDSNLNPNVLVINFKLFYNKTVFGDLFFGLDLLFYIKNEVLICLIN